MVLYPRNSKKNSGVCFTATIVFPVKFHMAPHIKRISKNYSVTVISSDIHASLSNYFDSNIKLIDVNIARRPSIVLDLLALIKLIKICKDNRFRCLHSVTPKAGLLTMVAGFIAGTPIRIHTFTGQVWASKKGLARAFYKFMDWTTAFFSTQVLADSNSQREFLISNKVVASNKIIVLGRGSIVGVDGSRFRPDASRRADIRRSFGIGSNDIVFIFVGRLAIDKGVADLLVAFNEVSQQCLDTHLFIVGPDEAKFDDGIPSAYQNLLGRIHRVKFTENPEWYMAAADILCMPSYREGFGNVVIEGASVGLPSIVSRIYGLSDAVIEGETGIFHEAGNIPQLTKAMLDLYFNSSLRSKLGFNARKNAISNFSQEILTRELEALYVRLGVF